MPITGEDNNELDDVLQQLKAALKAEDMDEVDNHVRQALDLLGIQE